MDKKIKKFYLEKIKLLNEHNKLYFDQNSPIISDAEYDELKKEILKLEKENPDLKSGQSPSDNI